MTQPATVIPMPRREGRPSNRDLVARLRLIEGALETARAELAARADEEREMDRSLAPLVRRMEAIAHDHGPAAHQTAAALAWIAERHARRWALRRAA